MNILIITGSTREGRFGDKASQWIMNVMANRVAKEIDEPNTIATYMDLKDLALPTYNEALSPGYRAMVASLDPQYDEAVKYWSRVVQLADAFIIVTPEYNHSTNAALKNAIDWLGTEWARKPVAFIGYGSVGGARAVEHLRGIAIEMQMAPIRYAVHIMNPWLIKDITELDSYEPAAGMMIDDLIWWTRVLKAGRDQK